MDIKIKKTNENAILPTYATNGSACFDLYAPKDFQSVDVAHGEPQSVNTGLAFEVPDDHVMLIFSRSGHGFKNDTRLANCVGVIDSDYRGDIAVKLTRDATTNDSPQMFVDAGDRIAQAMIIEVTRVTLVEVDKLSETSRGTGGFGHTGR